ncbi:MAG: enoyl-CoA hydratase/isomerase family protein [Candidatus Dadabacteria bacterium]|nr:MAG: enoyl-CoA hydratase/isomerase family protein [Candidatus Dadabacteria bacterium]
MGDVLFEHADVLLERQDTIARLRLRRKSALNALSSAFFDTLDAAIDALDAAEGVRAVILMSDVPKAFIAGADISEMKGKTAAEMETYARRGQRFMARIEQHPAIWVAAVNGYCLGGGFEVALSCDLIAAGPRATFAFPEIGLGLLPGFGGTQRFTRSAGMHAGLRYILTGERFGADTATALGLVWIAPGEDEDFDEVVGGAVEKAFGNVASVAAREVKRVVRAATWLSLEDGCDAEAAAFGAIGNSADAVEGLTAFLEKRKPEFRGN